MHKIKAKAIEKGITLENLAKGLGLCPITLRRKMKGESDFTIEESLKIKEMLGLTSKEYLDLFFDGKLEYNAYEKVEIA